MDTKELTLKVVDLEGKVAGHTEKMSDACARLEKVESAVIEQGKLLSSVEKLALGITHLGAKVDEMGNKLDIFGNRLREIEIEPGKNARGYWKIIATALITGLITYLITRMLPP